MCYPHIRRYRSNHRWRLPHQTDHFQLSWKKGLQKWHSTRPLFVLHIPNLAQTPRDRYLTDCAGPQPKRICGSSLIFSPMGRPIPMYQLYFAPWDQASSSLLAGLPGSPNGWYGNSEDNQSDKGSSYSYASRHSDSELVVSIVITIHYTFHINCF